MDDSQQRVVAEVLFASTPCGPFDYEVPDSFGERLEVGCRVRVPFGRGNRLVGGYCVGLSTRKRAGLGRRLKQVAAVLDERSLLSASMLRLTRWMADYYLCEWGQVLECVVPSAVRHGAGTRQASLLYVPEGVAEEIRALELSEKQAHALEVLARSPRPLTPKQLAAQAGCTAAPIAALRRKGLIESRVERVSSSEALAGPPPARETPPELNSDQVRALMAIEQTLERREHRAILIHGVTGSGKTEVYLRAIEKVVGFGRQAIVLVPEISLTPQTTTRFRARMDRVAVLHSHLTDAQRHHHWQRIAQGRVDVVVGARSAVFAPTPHLGLIILDEEHETTFKQEKVPRYHAREVARQRALMEGIPLILGSATPSLESWQRAALGQDLLVEMPRRVLNRPMPAVATIDLRQERQESFGRGAISRPLHEAIRGALERDGQVILLLNRRGHSTHIQCPACGQVVFCPNCDIALTHHRTEQKAVCHYCDYRQDVPNACAACGHGGIRLWGTGTQRLEAEVRARFPQSQCLRMDTDSMRRRGSHEDALRRFRDREVQILLGTQMIAKGLDFPSVTLVGVINADVALHLPDFRAAERTFHLVTQVAGRTGRGAQGGRVLVQTLDPDHPAIQAAVRHDYRRFARHELPVREHHGYPPFGVMVRLVVRSEREVPARAFADHLAQTVRRRCEEAEVAGSRVLGPAPAPLARLKGRYRFQIHVHAAGSDPLRTAVRESLAAVSAPDGVEWSVDVDPLDML
jgi:primosomal protein N' (replication factor Y)